MGGGGISEFAAWYFAPGTVLSSSALRLFYEMLIWGEIWGGGKFASRIVFTPGIPPQLNVVLVSLLLCLLDMFFQNVVQCDVFGVLLELKQELGWF